MVRVTVLGHAGMLVETAGGSVLCDPWFVPAFHGSWFVFPRNDGIDTEILRRPDYLYISHLHYDHFDIPFLTSNVDKSTPVLLPDFPTPELERALARLGFDRFIRCPDGEAVDLGELEVRIFTETAPSDGPIGDSALFLSDGTAKVLDQNDCRPSHPEEIARLGPVDLHLLQFSGAMWWPVVYDLPADEMSRHAAAKRESTVSRAVMYAKSIGARSVVPSAGPPCFLDPELFHLNDLDRSADNIFPDATVFLDRLGAEGMDGRLGVPGTVFELDGGEMKVVHPMSDDQLDRIFTHKRQYLDDYASDWAGWLDEHKATWPEPRPDLVGRLAEWWEPLLAQAPALRAAIGKRLLIRSGDEDVMVDFPAGEVRPWSGEEPDYRLDLPRPLVELCVEQQAVDWSNSLMLSFRFTAWRPGEYCEEIFSFLKSLNPERLSVLESVVAGTGATADELATDDVVIDGYRVQRRCPHRAADLESFGSVEGCVLTCSMHGWQFDLDTGRCLTSDSHTIRARRVEEDDGVL